MGMKGEGMTGEKVLIVKSHYPERMGLSTFECSKSIIIVRNPTDCISSLFNMVATSTHSSSIESNIF